MTDDLPTPLWLRKFFTDWYDPCPLHWITDGLKVPWRDPTFANIPYSDPMPWVLKAIREARNGIRVILLVQVDTSTRWWLELVNAGARFAFFHGRIRFTNMGLPRFSSALVFL